MNLLTRPRDGERNTRVTTQRQDAKFSMFDDTVSSFESIRQILREPMPAVVAKQIDYLDDVCRAIIEKSPFVVVPSADADGYPDILDGDGRDQ
jgi:hypothetical protein